MAPWEIWTFDFPTEGAYPCALKDSEVILDRADGLDWLTLCRIDPIHLVPKAGVRERRGMVSFERRRAISQRIYSIFPFQT